MTAFPARQRGGFLIGLVVGLLVGLGVALGVALYVSKVPIPFINKVPQRTAEQDAAEAERNKNWDPNAPLNGKAGARPAAPAATPGPAVPPPGIAPAPAAATARPGPASVPAPATAATAKPGAASSPAAPEAFVYFVQAGAYGRTEDAEQQRAKLAMLGFESRITEREQGGRTVYRVRVGPFDKRGDAEATQDKLAGNAVEAALVRVQK